VIGYSSWRVGRATGRYGVRGRLVNAEFTQLTLHELPEAGPVFAVETLQGVDLLLQSVTLRSQAPDDVVVSLLGVTLKSSRLGLGILGRLQSACPGVGKDLLGIAPSPVGMGLSIPDDHFRRTASVRQRLGSLPSGGVGVGLSITGDLLRRCPRTRPDAVGLVLSAGGVVVGRALGLDEHLKGSLGIRIGTIVHAVRLPVVSGCPASEQSSDPALHPTIGHRTTSIVDRSCAATCTSPARHVENHPAAVLLSRRP